MDTTQTLTVDYSDPQFFAALADPAGILPHLEDAMHGIMTKFVAQAEIPAPESAANKPGRMHIVHRATAHALESREEPMGYYERGRGWWYPLKTHNKLGLQNEIPTLGRHRKAPHTMGILALKAKGIQSVAGYKLIANSEQLEENWRAEVTLEGDAVTGELTNFASYSGYVQGQDQTQLMEDLQWRKVEDSWNSPAVQAAVTTETHKALDAYYHLSGA